MLTAIPATVHRNLQLCLSGLSYISLLLRHLHLEDNIDLSEYEDIDGLFREYKNIVLTETERRG